MVNFKQFITFRIVVPIAIGIILLLIPLLGDFHIESALLVSLIGCFWAGIRACDSPSKKGDFFTALRILGYLLLVGFPLAINALLTGCFSIDGLAFWLLFPLPSVFFGYAIGRLVRSWGLPRRRLITGLLILFVGVGIFLYELLTYPQVYFFNHVWGGWPGPIYDETVKINEATLFYRILTMLWAILLWQIPTINSDRWAKWIVGFSAVALLLGYTQLAEFGVISPRMHLQNVLGGQMTTKHFELYYDEHLYSKDEIDLLAKEHEFYFDQISNRLELADHDTTNKIESYLYGHPWQKKQLVGAKFTSYVPVWLDQDQLHIAKQQIAGSLKHEMVHVLAKEFGNNLFNASWSIGLIEGIAVAIDGGSLQSTVDQVVVSEKPYPNAQDLEQAFSVKGFYGGRSGVNYITSGSFVQFLIQNYPVDMLKQAYRTGSLAGAYPTGWAELAEQWHRHLDTVEVDSVDQQIAGRIFGMPSLFEKKCPHVVSDFAKVWDDYHFYLANGDTTQAMSALDLAVAEADSLPSVKSEWSYRNLVRGNTEKVQRATSLQDTTVSLQLLYADAFAMTGDWESAEPHLNRALKLFEEHPDSVLKPAIATRVDRKQWSIYRQMTYQNTLPDSVTFSEALYRTKIRSVRKALKFEQWSITEDYAQQLVRHPMFVQYFDEYLQLIHHLAFVGNRSLADQLLEQVSAMPLRLRYQQRLKHEREWLDFLTSTEKVN